MLLQWLESDQESTSALLPPPLGIVKVSVVVAELRNASVPPLPSPFKSTTVPAAGAEASVSEYELPLPSTAVSVEPLRLADTMLRSPKSI